MRYRRHGIYNAEKKAWETYYIKPDGELKLDKGKKTYNEVRKILSKNQGSVRPDDLLNKKESKIFYSPLIESKLEYQKEIKTLLKKKKLDKSEKKYLETLSENINYKQKEITKKLKIKPVKEKTVNYISMDVHATHHVTTSSQFFIAEKSFEKLQKAVAGMIKKNGIERLKVQFDKTDKIIDAESFEDIDEFDSAMSSLIEDQGITKYSSGMKNIKIIGVKR